MKEFLEKWKFKKTFFVSILVFAAIFYNTITTAGISSLKAYDSYLIGFVVWFFIFIVVWRFCVVLVLIMQDKRTDSNYKEMMKVQKFHDDHDLLSLKMIQKMQKEKSKKEK